MKLFTILVFFLAALFGMGNTKVFQLLLGTY